MTALYPSLPATNAKRLRKGAQATKQSTLSWCGDVDCFASLAMTWIGPGVELQQLRLFRRDRIVGTDRAAGDHLGIDPAVAVAEPALQRLRNGEVALGRIRIDIDGGAADDALHHLQPHVANGERSVEQIEFVPG